MEAQSLFQATANSGSGSLSLSCKCEHFPGKEGSGAHPSRPRNGSLGLLRRVRVKILVCSSINLSVILVWNEAAGRDFNISGDLFNKIWFISQRRLC